MGCTISCPDIQKFVLYGVPSIIIGIAGGIFVGLYCSGKWSSFVSSLDCFRPILKLLKEAFYIGIGLLTYVKIINSWQSVTGGSDVSDAPPPPGPFGFSKRCVPLFSATQQFITENVKAYNSSVVYVYDNTVTKFDAQVRLCTDAPEYVVSSFAQANNFTLLPTLDDFSGCPWEIIASKCMCAQLLQTPPLPNGFLYRIEQYKSPAPPNCDVAFTIKDSLSPCKNRYLYRLQNQVSASANLAGACALAISTVLFFYSIYFLLTRKSRGSNLSQEDELAYTFVSKTTVGKMFGFATGACFSGPPGHLTGVYFFLLFSCSFSEIVIFWVSISPCCVCGTTAYPFGFWELYYLLIGKIGCLLFDIKEYSFDNPPPKNESERIANLPQQATHADS
jgi:hypothetical protein